MTRGRGGERITRARVHGRAALRTAVCALAMTLAVTGCSGDGDGGTSATPTSAVPTFVVTSPDVEDGGRIPAANTADAYDGQCTGDNVALTLEWSDAPAATAAYAVTMIDIDAGEFAHWLLADIPGNARGVGPGATADAVQGRNGAGGTGYFGPCPPGPDHHYVVTVFALDAPLDLEPGFRLRDLQTALASHVLAVASLTGERSGPA